MDAFISHWDNSRFHKASTYTRPDNRPALVLLKRYGYSQVAHLEDHIFGEDYFVMERKFTKAVDGYDNGISLPLATRLKLKARGSSTARRPPRETGRRSKHRSWPDRAPSPTARPTKAKSR